MILPSERKPARSSSTVSHSHCNQSRVRDVSGGSQQGLLVTSTRLCEQRASWVEAAYVAMVEIAGGSHADGFAAAVAQLRAVARVTISALASARAILIVPTTFSIHAPNVAHAVANHVRPAVAGARAFLERLTSHSGCPTKDEAALSDKLVRGETDHDLLAGRHDW